jgi:hypothetical protein
MHEKNVYEIDPRFCSAGKRLVMDKLQLTGRNLGRVFNFRSGHLHAADLWCSWVELPDLNLKTRPKQLPLGMALCGLSKGLLSKEW